MTDLALDAGTLAVLALSFGVLVWCVLAKLVEMAGSFLGLLRDYERGHY